MSNSCVKNGGNGGPGRSHVHVIDFVKLTTNHFPHLKFKNKSEIWVPYSVKNLLDKFGIVHI